MRTAGWSRRALVLVCLATLIAAGCAGSDDGVSNDAQPAPVDRQSICQINPEQLVFAVSELPDRVDEDATLGVADIHRENGDNMFANDCDIEVIDQVDAALCDYLSSTPAADTTKQEALDATASSYCKDPPTTSVPTASALTPTTTPTAAGLPDSTTTMPADPPIAGATTVCPTIEDDFLVVIETVGGLVEQDELALLESLGLDLADLCGGGSAEFCDDLSALLPLVETNAAEVTTASGCP